MMDYSKHTATCFVQSVRVRNISTCLSLFGRPETRLLMSSDKDEKGFFFWENKLQKTEENYFQLKVCVTQNKTKKKRKTHNHAKKNSDYFRREEDKTINNRNSTRG
ncbi:hypothetical protein GHT06_018012 [Daphnia sinensis]|uniref:Uncharacterized protein n=1 Tax=Daphnia sinensis TaxID=1820382 RepID=A0AAD5PQJ1_9CRUS|nr:hypothetical protein GHT06_018012 [Daphnia sinensis]